MDKLWNLQELDLFSELKPNTLEQVLWIITVRHIERGEYVFRPGDPCDRLYLLHHGCVKTHVYSESGQENIMHIFRPGDAFGGLLLGTTHGEVPWAQDMDDVIVSYMDESNFKKIYAIIP